MRATNGPKTRAKRKAIKRQVEGHWGTKHTSYKIARQSLLRAKGYAYRDRKQKKRNFRSLWVLRINNAIRPLGANYSQFIKALSDKKVAINRKMISEMAINNPAEFQALVVFSGVALNKENKEVSPASQQ